MPKCPFCGDYFVSDEELTSHILSDHPEKVSTPDSIARAMVSAGQEQNIRQLAAQLTHTSLSSGVSVDQVVQRYHEVLLGLRALFREYEGDSRVSR